MAFLWPSLIINLFFFKSFGRGPSARPCRPRPLLLSDPRWRRLTIRDEDQSELPVPQLVNPRLFYSRPSLYGRIGVRLWSRRSRKPSGTETSAMPVKKYQSSMEINQGSFDSKNQLLPLDSENHLFSNTSASNLVTRPFASEAARTTQTLLAEPDICHASLGIWNSGNHIYSWSRKGSHKKSISKTSNH